MFQKEQIMYTNVQPHVAKPIVSTNGEDNPFEMYPTTLGGGVAVGSVILARQRGGRLCIIYSLSIAVQLYPRVHNSSIPEWRPCALKGIVSVLSCLAF